MRCLPRAAHEPAEVHSTTWRGGSDRGERGRKESPPACDVCGCVCGCRVVCKACRHPCLCGCDEQQPCLSRAQGFLGAASINRREDWQAAAPTYVRLRMVGWQSLILREDVFPWRVEAICSAAKGWRVDGARGRTRVGMISAGGRRWLIWAGRGRERVGPRTEWG